MLKSKSRIALALVLALTSAAPAFAMKMGGPEWLTMMEKIRTDKANPEAPLWVSMHVTKANVPGHKLTISHEAIPKIHMRRPSGPANPPIVRRRSR